MMLELFDKIKKRKESSLRYQYLRKGPEKGWVMKPDLYAKCPKCGYYMSLDPTQSDMCPCGNLSKDIDFGRFGATTEIDANIKAMWYRFSRRENDYCIECSEDGITFKQMRICHMWNGSGVIQFGIYACSPEDSSFKATFTNMEVTECKWMAHDGQQPDKESS